MMYYGVIGAVMAYMFLYQYNGKRGCIDTYFVKIYFIFSTLASLDIIFSLTIMKSLII